MLKVHYNEYPYVLQLHSVIKVLTRFFLSISVCNTADFPRSPQHSSRAKFSIAAMPESVAGQVFMVLCKTLNSIPGFCTRREWHLPPEPTAKNVSGHPWGQPWSNVRTSNLEQEHCCVTTRDRNQSFQGVF